MKLRSSAYANVLNTPSAAELLRQGLAFHQQGRLERAMELYERVLKLSRNDADALNLLGVAKMQLGETAEAISLLERAVTARPNDPSIWVHLGNARLQSNAPDLSIAAYDRAIALSPQDADIRYNRANVFAAMGRHYEAIPGFGDALQLNPGHPGARFNLANSLMATECFLEAISHYELVAKSAAEFPNLWTNIGICLVNLRLYGEAETAFRTALRHSPQDAVAHGNLGSLLTQTERWPEAIEAHTTAVHLAPADLTARLNLARTLQRARKHSAISVAETATELAPASADAWIVLGDARLEFGMTDEVLEAYEKALTLNPDCLQDTNNLGLGYYRCGRLDEAIAFYESALDRRPKDSDAWADLGIARLHRGDVEGAVTNLDRSVELQPDNEFAHSTLLLCHCYSAHHTGEEIRAEAEAWVAKHTPRGIELPRVHVQAKSRLRIGYQSADFHFHPAGNLYAALFPNHDRERYELIGYSTNPFRDGVSEQIIASCSAFHEVSEVHPEDLAKKIREDEIDILIDLLGHTPGHRLKAFGYRPAPVQATWLGYFGTTGMAQMDFILCDHHVLPEAHEGHFTERPARMPNCMYAYQPPKLAIEPGELPMAGNGHITFGCFNNLSKIHEEVVALWCEAMHASPGSRMILNRWPFSSEQVRETYWSWFEQHGIDRGRVELRYTKGREDYFRTYQEVDLMLDSFPFGGGTTTSDALWMGVPVLTLSADRFVGRMTETILHTVGVPELLPSDRSQFVGMAAGFADNPSRLGAYRSGLRAQLVSSPMCDIPQFTRDLESTYEWMWAQKTA